MHLGMARHFGGAGATRQRITPRGSASLDPPYATGRNDSGRPGDGVTAWFPGYCRDSRPLAGGGGRLSGGQSSWLRWSGPSPSRNSSMSSSGNSTPGIVFSSLNQAPRSMSLQRSLQNGRQGDCAGSQATGVLQVGQWMVWVRDIQSMQQRRMNSTSRSVCAARRWSVAGSMKRTVMKCLLPLTSANQAVSAGSSTLISCTLVPRSRLRW